MQRPPGTAFTAGKTEAEVAAKEPDISAGEDRDNFRTEDALKEKTPPALSLGLHDEEELGLISSG